MKQILKFGFILGVICLTATFVLAVTYEITKPKIEEQRKQEEQSALKLIIKGADDFVEKQSGDMDYFEAYSGGKLVGYCLRVTGNGYGGYIRMLVGVDKAGTILGIKVLEQYETPGLGTKITEVKPGETEPYFLNQFIGKNGADVELRKNIDAITGATISSRGVTKAVREAVKQFMDVNKGAK